MPNYIVIKNNTVVNIIDAPSLEIAEEASGLTCVEHTFEKHVGAGWTYDGLTFEEPTE